MTIINLMEIDHLIHILSWKFKFTIGKSVIMRFTKTYTVKYIIFFTLMIEFYYFGHIVDY